jgi:hypothetical protein
MISGHGAQDRACGAQDSAYGAQDRAFGVWGARAFAWSGEEPSRAAGFPIDLTGRQRALGFPARISVAREAPAEPGREAMPPEGRHVRLVVAVVAILGRRGHGRGPHLPQ